MRFTCLSLLRCFLFFVFFALRDPSRALKCRCGACVVNINLSLYIGVNVGLYIGINVGLYIDVDVGLYIRVNIGYILM